MSAKRVRAPSAAALAAIAAADIVAAPVLVAVAEMAPAEAPKVEKEEKKKKKEKKRAPKKVAAKAKVETDEEGDPDSNDDQPDAKRQRPHGDEQQGGISCPHCLQESPPGFCQWEHCRLRSDQAFNSPQNEHIRAKVERESAGPTPGTAPQHINTRLSKRDAELDLI
jgi:hypothetical protein